MFELREILNYSGNALHTLVCHLAILITPLIEVEIEVGKLIEILE
jgi:hypothetical protein